MNGHASVEIARDFLIGLPSLWSSQSAAEVCPRAELFSSIGYVEQLVEGGERFAPVHSQLTPDSSDRVPLSIDCLESPRQ